MNKKKLMAQVEELYNIVKETEANNASLKKRVDELLIMLGAKDFEIEELKKQVEELKKIPTPQEKLYTVADTLAKNSETVLEETKEPKIEEPTEEIEDKEVAFTKDTEQNDTETEALQITAPQVKYIDSESIEDEISKYAAKAISNVSLKAAMLSNLLAASGNANAKDLLTLTLGRSEVFKQRVFETTKSGANIDAAKASINLLEAETLEYFEQLKAQL